MKRVLIATPSYDGRLDVWYVNSLVGTIRMSLQWGIEITPIYVSFDALIQRARNDLVKIAVDNDFDAMIFIDSDMEWEPSWIMELIDREEDIVGGTARKKTDDAEIYVHKAQSLEYKKNGLLKCDGLGTGFVKLSRKAFMAAWDSSEEYHNEGQTSRMVFDIGIVNGELYSEDMILFKKLTELGFECWLDPSMTCAHIGRKKYTGNMAEQMEKMGQLH